MREYSIRDHEENDVEIGIRFDGWLPPRCKDFILEIEGDTSITKLYDMHSSSSTRGPASHTISLSCSTAKRRSNGSTTDSIHSVKQQYQTLHDWIWSGPQSGSRPHLDTSQVKNNLIG